MSSRKRNNEGILPQVARGLSNIEIIDATTNMDNAENTKKPNYKVIDKENRKFFLTMAYLAICVLAIGLCVASFSVKSLQKASLKGLRMWQWCLLIAALLSGPLLSYGIVKFLLLFIDRDFSIRENVIYYVVGLGESAAVVLWFSMILVAWLWVIDEPSYLGLPQQDIGKIKKKYATSFHIITVTLVTFILGSFLWLLKDLVIKKAKSEFHTRRFFDRIKTALLHQYIIERLCQDSPVIMSNPVELTASSGYKKRLRHSFKKVGLGSEEKRFINLSSFEDVSQENVSCWGMKILIQGILENPNLSFIFIRENGKVNSIIDSDSQAADVAKDIFSWVTGRTGGQPRFIGKQQLSKIFPEKLQEVMKCLVEESRCDDIEAVSFEKWMVNVYRYRNALFRALEANKSLFKTFNRFVDALLIFLIFALWLIMIRVETRKVIFLIGTAIVGSAFIFGETCKKVLENILFVFLVHPFDIGDCCLLDNTLGIIEEINFLTTAVVTFDNEMKRYPNAVLSGQCITNYSRSPRYMGDSVTISLDIRTSIEKINNLKDYISRYIEGHQQYWNKKHNWAMELENNNNASTIKLTLRIQHTINYHELTDRQTRKNALVLEFKKALDNLGTPDDIKPEMTS